MGGVGSWAGPAAGVLLLLLLLLRLLPLLPLLTLHPWFFWCPLSHLLPAACH